MVVPNKRVYNNDENNADVDGSDNNDDDDDDNDIDNNDDDDDDDDCIENLILIKSEIINFYHLWYEQSGIPRSEGFLPARKRKRMTG